MNDKWNSLLLDWQWYGFYIIINIYLHYSITSVKNIDFFQIQKFETESKKWFRQSYMVKLNMIMQKACYVHWVFSTRFFFITEKLIQIISKSEQSALIWCCSTMRFWSEFVNKSPFWYRFHCFTSVIVSGKKELFENYVIAYSLKQRLH